MVGSVMRLYTEAGQDIEDGHGIDATNNVEDDVMVDATTSGRGDVQVMAMWRRTARLRGKEKQG